MKPGVRRQLGMAETARLAASRAELTGKSDLVAFEYIDHSAAAAYADRNRQRGHQVVGPFHNGQGWFCVIMQGTREGGHDDQAVRGPGNAVRGPARPAAAVQHPPADQAAQHAGDRRHDADGA